MIDWTSLRRSLIGNRAQFVLPLRVKLPIMPLSVMKFAQLAEDPNASPEEFARIIETDSSLTGEFLRFINSSATGLTHKVRCIQQAIAVVGIQQCKLYLLMNAVKRSMKGVESRLIDITQFWASNLERALFAREIAVLMEADHDLAFAGGMLQDFLLPVITNNMYSKYQEFLELQREQPISLRKFEREKFQWDHAEAEGNVMLGWGFPDNLICCVLFHHHGRKVLSDKQLKQSAVAAVAMSAYLPDPMAQEVDGIKKLLLLEQTNAELDLATVAKCVDQRFSEMSPVGVNRIPLQKRLERSLALVH